MKYITPILLALLLIPAAQAAIQLENLVYDPAVISAGDTVALTVEFRTDTSDNERYNDADWQYEVRLLADDDVSREYIRITDSSGNDIPTSFVANNRYAKQFRLKIDEQAPTGVYELRLQGQWYHNGVAEGASEYRRITIDVRREAIALDIASINSEPVKIRAGDSDIAMKLQVANSGQKAAVNTRISAELPEGFVPASSTGSQAYLGGIAAADSQEATMYIDVLDTTPAGEHDISYTLTYRDETDNTYERIITRSIYLAEKPRLTITNASLEAARGTQADLRIVLTNTGSQKAEAIDVRLLKESNQPFRVDTRSSYIAELGIDKSAEVIIPVRIDNDAAATTHSVPVLIRAKGDSERNDNTVYTYRDHAEITTFENSTNHYVAAGIVIIVLATALLVWRKKR